eukprot:CAMPEP_0172710912 /NCGR_PEP_ID=MMETSP1074-20121228/57303_1 /TAXON_ID=2916 /ORGANISM="Ceratium fusus, Strain PA161109" /LENGTH=115 /DNA_ID=CAMNT_0013534443 /DNA_START=73 /DNA_END=420 /DNA_ORIENTATION=+
MASIGSMLTTMARAAALGSLVLLMTATIPAPPELQLPLGSNQAPELNVQNGAAAEIAARLRKVAVEFSDDMQQIRMLLKRGQVLVPSLRSSTNAQPQQYSASDAAQAAHLGPIRQ